MEKTADLAMIQKTNIDAIHKESKSQRVITERCGCLQSAVSKHIKCKVDWKEESPRSDVFRKRATKPLLNQRQRQKHLTWAVEKKNWTVAQWSKVLFQMKVNLAFHLEIKVPESGGRVERHRMLLEVQCEVSTVSDDLGCHVICWCWSTVFSEVHSQRSHLPGNFRALHASFC